LEGVLTQLARENGMDPGADEEARSFHLPPFEVFCLEFQGGALGRVCVGYYYERNGDQVPDPEIWLARTPAGWVPTSISQLWGGARHCAREAGNGAVEVTDAKVLAEIVEFAEAWAELIEARYLHNEEVAVVAH
jgi:hypothetical protein